jgi:hypothetical protein
VATAAAAAGARDESRLEPYVCFFFFFLLSYFTNVLSLILKEYNLALTLSKLVVLELCLSRFTHTTTSFSDGLLEITPRCIALLNQADPDKWEKRSWKNIFLASAYMHLIFGLEEQV